MRLGRLTGRDDLEQRGTTLLERHVARYRRYPSAYAEALLACDEVLGPSLEATLACGDNREEAQKMLTMLRQARHPRLLLLWRGHNDDDLDRLAPRQKGQAARNGRTTTYLCSGRRCLPPATSCDALRKQLAELGCR